jgi:hypothetical protein
MIMKALRIGILIFFTLVVGTAFAQGAVSESMPSNRMNVIKTNLLSPLSIGYERGLGKHFSLTGYFLYFPKVSFGAPTDRTGFVQLFDPSMGGTGEVRYYTSKTKAPLNGFYVGGYFLFRTGDVFFHKVSTGTNVTTVKAYIPSDLTSGGLMIGKQRIRAGGFTTDFNFGIGYYSLGNIPSVVDDNSEAIKILSQLSKYKSGIGPRLNFCLGYAF